MLQQSLREALGNKPRNTELTPDERKFICELVGAGKKPTKVARDLNLSPTTVLGVVNRASQQEHGRSRPRSGRPRLLSPADERYILLLLKRNPTISHREIRERTRVTVCDRTLGGIISKTRSAYLQPQKGPSTSQMPAKGPGGHPGGIVGMTPKEENNSPSSDDRDASEKRISTSLGEGGTLLESQVTALA